jgi:hypothetical protein
MPNIRGTDLVLTPYRLTWSNSSMSFHFGVVFLQLRAEQVLVMMG